MAKRKKKKKAKAVSEPAEIVGYLIEVHKLQAGLLNQLKESLQPKKGKDQKSTPKG